MKLARSSPCRSSVGDPLRVLHVGLAPGHRLDVLGVDHQHLQLPLQQVVHRLPVAPRWSPSPRGCSPPPASQSSRASRSAVIVPKVRSSLAGPPAAPGRHQAGHHALLMHIEPAAPLVHHLHRPAPLTLAPPEHPRAASSVTDSAMHARRADGGTSARRSVYASGSRYQPTPAILLGPPHPGYPPRSRPGLFSSLEASRRDMTIYHATTVAGPC